MYRLHLAFVLRINNDVHVASNHFNDLAVLNYFDDTVWLIFARLLCFENKL